MSDFPSESDFFWLLLGLLPLAWLIYRALRWGLAEFATIGAVVLMSLWLGYHLTPWLAVPAGGWDSFLLRPQYITEGIRYATLSMLTFLVAYEVAERSHGKGGPGFGTINFTEVPKRWIWIGCAVVLVAVLVNRGGPLEVLWSSQPRGAGQFEERDTVGRLFRVLAVFLMPASSVLSLLASLYLAKARDLGMLVRRLPLAGVALLVASLNAFFSFSRGAGFAFVLLAVTLVVVRGSRALLPAALAVGIAVWLGLVGYTQRGGANMPGVANYLGAVVAPDTERLYKTLFGRDSVDGSEESSIEPTANIFNALDPWTTRAWTLERTERNLFDGLLGLVQILQPFPSEFVPWQSRAGESLSDVMGTAGSTGLTTPALAELYYLFGDPGLIFVAGFGLLAARAQHRMRRQLGPMSSILWASFALGSIIGLHQGLRAMTRLILYALVILGLLVVIRRLHASRRSSLVDSGSQSVFGRDPDRVCGDEVGPVFALKDKKAH